MSDLRIWNGGAAVMLAFILLPLPGARAEESAEIAEPPKSPDTAEAPGLPETRAQTESSGAAEPPGLRLTLDGSLASDGESSIRASGECGDVSVFALYLGRADLSPERRVAAGVATRRIEAGPLKHEGLFRIMDRPARYDADSSVLTEKTRYRLTGEAAAPSRLGATVHGKDGTDGIVVWKKTGSKAYPCRAAAYASAELGGGWRLIEAARLYRQTPEQLDERWFPEEPYRPGGYILHTAVAVERHSRGAGAAEADPDGTRGGTGAAPGATPRWRRRGERLCRVTGFSSTGTAARPGFAGLLYCSRTLPHTELNGLAAATGDTYRDTDGRPHEPAAMLAVSMGNTERDAGQVLDYHVSGRVAAQAAAELRERGARARAPWSIRGAMRWALRGLEDGESSARLGVVVGRGESPPLDPGVELTAEWRSEEAGKRRWEIAGEPRLLLRWGSRRAWSVETALRGEYAWELARETARRADSVWAHADPAHAHADPACAHSDCGRAHGSPQEVLHGPLCWEWQTGLAAEAGDWRFSADGEIGGQWEAGRSGRDRTRAPASQAAERPGVSWEADVGLSWRGERFRPALSFAVTEGNGSEGLSFDDRLRLEVEGAWRILDARQRGD